MLDLTPRTIKRLFEEQIKELTLRTLSEVSKEEYFDYQLSGGWLK